MLISEQYYKSIYTESEIDKTTFDEYANAVKIYFLSRIVYSEAEITSMQNLENIKLMLAHQINYFEKYGLYDDGIVSQSTNGSSQSISNKKSKGQLNISSVFDLFISINGLGVRKC